MVRSVHVKSSHYIRASDSFCPDGVGRTASSCQVSGSAISEPRRHAPGGGGTGPAPASSPGGDSALSPRRQRKDAVHFSRRTHELHRHFALTRPATPTEAWARQVSAI